MWQNLPEKKHCRFYLVTVRETPKTLTPLFILESKWEERHYYYIQQRKCENQGWLQSKRSELRWTHQVSMALPVVRQHLSSSSAMEDGRGAVPTDRTTFWPITSLGFDLTEATATECCLPPAPYGSYSLKPHLPSSPLSTTPAHLHPQDRSVACSSRVAFISFFLLLVIYKSFSFARF